MPNYAFTLPYAMTPTGPEVLLGQRHLIQKRVGGKAVQGVIPEWAGQWGLIGGLAKDGETAEAAAIRTFNEQTGINLGDKAVVTDYFLANQTLVPLKTKDYTAFSVWCLFTTTAALNRLPGATAATIAGAKESEGTLEQAKVFTVKEAQAKLGPVKAPPDGWQKYLFANYFGGKAPGQLNTEVNTLISKITDATGQKDSFFTTGLGTLEKP